jgi:hypothetical protein
MNITDSREDRDQTDTHASTLALPGLAVLAIAVTVGVFVGFFIDQERRWR